MNNKELVHIWAQQTKESGKGSNMFFEGATIYSYGYHFPIATIHKDNKKDIELVLFTSKGYSPTTAKHKNFVANAITNRRGVVCPLVNPKTMADHRINSDYILAQLEKTKKEALSAKRSGKDLVLHAHDLSDDYNDYITFFKVRRKRLTTRIFSDDQLEEVKKKRAVYLKQQQEREARQNAVNAEKLNEWAQGTQEQTLSAFYGLPIRLRLKNGHVETSRGANVTIEEAKIALSAFNANQLNEGAKIGDYTVTRWDEEKSVLVIGCHNIPLVEIENLNNLLETN